MASKIDVANEFYRVLMSFIESLADTFDDCEATRDIALLMQKLDSPDFRLRTIKKFHSFNHQNYGKPVREYIQSKALKKIPVLSKIEIGKKFNSASRETQVAIVEYIEAMNEQAKIYSLIESIPDSVMTKVNSVKQRFFDYVGKPKGEAIDFDKISVGQVIRFIKGEYKENDVSLTQAEILELFSLIMPYIKEHVPENIAKMITEGGTNLDPTKLFSQLMMMQTMAK